MPYKDHPHFPLRLSDATIIWRYSSVSKLLALFESSSLHFTRIDKLGDPFEGTLPAANLSVPMSPDPKLAEYLQRTTIESTGLRNSIIFANCWYFSPHESVAMWRLYGGANAGVAVKSTLGGLKSALTPATSDVNIGEVRYIDYDTTMIPTGNAYYFALHKRLAYAHEHEVRALLTHGGAHPPPQYAPGPEEGVDMSVDLSALVQAIHIAPGSGRWFAKLVEDVARRNGLITQIVPSILDARPLG